MYYGSSADRYRDFVEDSTTHKLKSAYWSTKQTVIRKLGREEDKYVVASDCELDAKLALFKSVQTTCQDLMLCTDRYLRSIYGLSQAENEMGRFLKSKSSEDKTRAGKMLAAVGKALSHSAQQRLALQNPLTRLQQEVQTFRNRAIDDTASTIKRTEAARNDYRGALLWMKNVSEELDPDMGKKLEKFRRVQTQVRKSKATFDRLKLASMQKVDLLAASRCNMLSQVLAAYQDTLLQFWERTARQVVCCPSTLEIKTMVSVSESFKGYQYYEFSLLKELTPAIRKLAQETSKSAEDDTENDSSPDSGTHSKKSPVHIETDEGATDAKNDKDAVEDFFLLQDLDFDNHQDRSASKEGAEEPAENLLDEAEMDKKLDSLFPDDLLTADDHLPPLPGSAEDKNGPSDLLGPTASEDSEFLNDILSMAPLSPTTGEDKASASEKPSGIDSLPLFKPFMSSTDLGQPGSEDSPFHLNWDSHLMQMTDTHGSVGGSTLSSPTTGPTGGFERTWHSAAATAQSAGNLSSNASTSSQPPKGPIGTTKKKPSNKPTTGNVDDWMKFFADLTPMGNPDQQSKKTGHVLDA
nr:unnamed protein product [Spirometra erinaceieuropaei]